jgi:SAM-dependent methyltransferase
MVDRLLDASDWYNTHLGKILASLEKENIGPVLSTLFGYHIIQLCGDQSYISSARVKHAVFIARSQHSLLQEKNLCSSTSSLPIETDSVDVVVLPHTLEISSVPHEVLREVERILIPEGHIVIMGFNPWSLIGLRRFVSFRSQRFPWCVKYFSVSRVSDWLALLGFDVQICNRHFFAVPFQAKRQPKKDGWGERVGQKFWPWFSGAYILLAKKRVSTITLIRSRGLKPVRLDTEISAQKIRTDKIKGENV